MQHDKRGSCSSPRVLSLIIFAHGLLVLNNKSMCLSHSDPSEYGAQVAYLWCVILIIIFILTFGAAGRLLIPKPHHVNVLQMRQNWKVLVLNLQASNAYNTVKLYSAAHALNKDFKKQESKTFDAYLASCKAVSELPACEPAC